MNETSQAIAHCTKITNAAYLLPNSLLTVATAATQGVYNKQKIKNTNAVNFENKTGSFVTSPPNKTVKVLTTLSFAINPVINAVEILQSEIPNGLNNGTIEFPSIASKLCAESVTKFNFASKVCKNQIIIVAQKIMVKAFVIKPFAL